MTKESERRFDGVRWELYVLEIQYDRGLAQRNPGPEGPMVKTGVIVSGLIFLPGSTGSTWYEPGDEPPGRPFCKTCRALRSTFRNLTSPPGSTL